MSIKKGMRILIYFNDRSCVVSLFFSPHRPPAPSLFNVNVDCVHPKGDPRPRRRDLIRSPKEDEEDDAKNGTAVNLRSSRAMNASGLRSRAEGARSGNEISKISIVVT